MKAARILIVGEAGLAEICVARLEQANSGHVLMVIDQHHSDRVVSIAEAFRPDAVLLLSIRHLAPLDGVEVCRQLRASAAAGGAKIILFSSDSLARGLRAAREGGADAFIGKPFDPDKLIEMLEQMLQ